ncbi:hypothetical protein EXIGLDRAFT_842063 [Exidia glandulosa HHB12029]|uniref:Uncharacterized protein n=1 Tax=Exidia glandulosa HHB12029 TaxID=1314781 RepID=A0A165DIK9_EXIGL|nr:hypothetical protein EXIGLDRAFT_842063 [Exidia glandulosa HHB12029]
MSYSEPNTATPVDYLEQYRVPCFPEVYYIPDFITEHEVEFHPRSTPAHVKNACELAVSSKLASFILARMLTSGQAADMGPDLVTHLRDTGVFESATHGQSNHVSSTSISQNSLREDGPAYHHVVGTISLGSHAVFNYYKYADRTPSTDAPTDAPPNNNNAGRAVDRTPLVSLPSPAHRSTPDISTASRSVCRTFSVGTTA